MHIWETCDKLNCLGRKCFLKTEPWEVFWENNCSIYQKSNGERETDKGD